MTTDNPGDRRGEQEEELLVRFLFALRAAAIRTFLRRHDLTTSGTRDDLRERVEAALADGSVTYDDIVRFLDEEEPWGRQHVFLFGVDEGAVAEWRDAGAVERRLQNHGLAEVLDQSLLLRLPDELTLSSIRLSARELEVVAVERREHTERRSDLDQPGEHGGLPVEFRAYVRVVTRGLVTLRWDLQSNDASLHITQASTGYSYDEAQRRFRALVGDWLPWRFPPFDITRALRRLHDAERAGTGETRSHRLGYRSPGGRLVDVASATSDQSVLGEAVLDQAIENVAHWTPGRVGNFYWLDGRGPDPARNPLAKDEEAHVILLADDSRLHFRTPQPEEVNRYVLRRVRALSR